MGDTAGPVDGAQAMASTKARLDQLEAQQQRDPLEGTDEFAHLYPPNEALAPDPEYDALIRELYGSEDGL